MITQQTPIQVPSPPVRGRGLKPEIAEALKDQRQVAPRAGAWIETLYFLMIPLSVVVAPRAGAWIETG